MLSDLGEKEVPEAYMAFSLYNSDSVEVARGKHPLSEASKNKHEFLSDTLKVEEDGYIEVYLVNETSENVWFDDFTVQSTTPIIVQESHYYPFGSELTGLAYNYNNHINREKYNGKEFQDELNLGWYDYGARMYDPLLGRWGVVDPLADQRSWLTPYNYVQNNPIIRIDPDGRLDDYFKNQDGEVQWFNNSSQGFSDSGGNSWSNIGTELIDFDGSALTYNWQTGNEFSGFKLHSERFDAVSGQGLDPTGYWNRTRIFDYSRDRQRIRDVGPVPEGTYSINKRPFVPGSNESGFQQFEDIDLVRKMVAPLGGSNWPGGTHSWGEYRWKLQNEGAQTFGRDNFYLHGGGLWGSRGCIDCGAGINAFTQSFMNRDLGNEKVVLRVKYPENLRFNIQNNPTNQGIKFLDR
ncbi:RHS repeat domain-containing protein [Belliella pelovolcani]|uniref:RHS repeat-associated core domain-containing protein n=1 Tax=Belliella pelovolcani TaxID=529505 RepID=A0A1N7PUF9_9BACT|nr:RHS repeat-associated core domain-containing protein [Belliella pelovolcani]SIT14273.1 RHS repeat-associated core domain-containing protein [Belliella pelovolcani]